MSDDLKRSTFFAGFDEKALADITGFSHKTTLEPNKVIFDRDDVARNVYVVLKGRVRQGFEVSPGTDVWFQTSEPGGIFGLNSLIPPKVHNMRAVATERTELVAIDAESLQSYLETNPGFGLVFMERIAQLLQQRLNNCRLQVIHLMPPTETQGPTLATR